MKKKTTKIRLSKFKFLLFLPLLLLSFCDSNLGEPALELENRLTKDAKIFSLMKAAIQNDSDQNLTKNKGDISKSTATEADDQCTYFLYPMTFEVYSGDNPTPQLKEINSDEELIAFIDTFTFEDEMVASAPNYQFYIYFPIILLDTDGVETELNNLTELEGTLQMAVDACAGFVEDASDTSDDTSGTTDDTSDASDGTAEDSGESTDTTGTADDTSDASGGTTEDSEESTDATGTTDDTSDASGGTAEDSEESTDATDTADDTSGGSDGTAEDSEESTDTTGTADDTSDASGGTTEDSEESTDATGTTDDTSEGSGGTA
ncbi:MAG: hypothetical protein OEM04_11915, partial [Flavobacteriaceae bacterium]|nr:hypothetical protein [Flavobacteriaceae bacterium]